jgi:hypothetical protein
MNLKLWPRTQRDDDGLRDDVRRLAAVVEQLVATERKNTEQLKKLREAIEEGRTAWREIAKTAATAAEDARKAAEGQRGLTREWRRAAERSDSARKVEGKWRKIFYNQVSALVRHMCLPLDQLRPPYDLTARRFRLRSQNEEDGMLIALLERAGWGSRRFVEIGSGKTGGNAATLALECGWEGLMIELSAEAAAVARHKFATNSRVTVVNDRVTPESVNALLARHRFDGEVDVLSIDIDSYDYWVLDALTATSPRILVLEYNALFGPERRVTIPLGQPLDAAPKGYSGASLAALTDLARRKGYRLVACEHLGVNAFFLRNDVAPATSAVEPGVAFRVLRSRSDPDDREIPTDIYETIRGLNLPLVDV